MKKREKKFNELFSSIKAQYILLALIVLIGAILRFYNFPFRYSLGDETVREAVVGLQGARTLQTPLMGAFSSAAPFVWGPWFYYQVILISLIFPYSYAPWIYLTISSILSIFILYKIGEHLENQVFGLILAVLGAVSPALIVSAFHLTFPNLLSFFVLVTLWFFIRLIKNNGNNKQFFYFGLLLGITLNIHYQAIAYVLLPIVMFAYFIYIKQFKLNKVGWFLAGTALTFIPLILFELTNHWFNIRNIFYYYTEGKKAIYIPNRWLFYVRDFWPALWSEIIGIPKILSIVMAFLGSLFLFINLLKKKISISMFLVLIIFVFEFIIYRYFWGPRFGGYFVFMRPFIFIISGYAFFWIYQNVFLKIGKIPAAIFTSLLLVGLSTGILVINKNTLEKDTFTVYVYQEVDKLLKTYPDKKFYLYVCPAQANSYNTAMEKSVLFLLDKYKKIDPHGKKIAFYIGTCFNPELNIPEQILKQKIDTRDKKITPFLLTQKRQIPGTVFVDFSNVSHEKLKNAQWSPLTFQVIYDSIARWWYEEKP